MSGVVKPDILTANEIAALVAISLPVRDSRFSEILASHEALRSALTEAEETLGRVYDELEFAANAASVHIGVLNAREITREFSHTEEVVSQSDKPKYSAGIRVIAEPLVGCTCSPGVTAVDCMWHGATI